MPGNATSTTVESLKRKAKALKKEFAIPLHEALELASRFEGYGNYHQAYKTLSGTPHVSVHSFTIYVSAFWIEKETQKHGRVTVSIPTTKLFDQLVTPYQLKNNSLLSSCQIRANDHLQYLGHYVLSTKDKAMERCCDIARLIQFMDTTGLVPSKARQKALPKVASVGDGSLPQKDHSSVWYQPETKKYLLADEPYETALHRNQTARQEWAEQFNFSIAQAKWKGMYFPHGGTVLQLISHKEKGVKLAPILSALAKCPAPVTPENLDADIAYPSTPFQSPLEMEADRVALDLSQATKVSSTSKKFPKRELYHFRKLVILGLNEILSQGKLSLDAPDSDRSTGEKGHIEVTLAGRSSMILWRDIGYGEIRVSVWLDYDHSKHPQAKLEGSSRETFQGSIPLAKRAYFSRFVGATASGWLERKTGRFLQGRGKNSIFDTYLRADMKPVLQGIPNPEPLGFRAEG
nr:hypothetical protein [uncultured Cohaesibacter sp.]